MCLGLVHQPNPVESLFFVTEWRSRVLRVGGAVRCVGPVTVTQAKGFTKTATKPPENAAAR